MNKIIIAFFCSFFLLVTTNLNAQGGRNYYSEFIGLAEKALAEKDFQMFKLELYEHALVTSPWGQLPASKIYKSPYIRTINKYRKDINKLGFTCDKELQKIYSNYKFNRIFFGLVALLNGTWEKIYKDTLYLAAKDLSQGCITYPPQISYEEMSSFLAILKNELKEENVTIFDDFVAKKEAELKVIEFMLGSMDVYKQIAYSGR